MGRFTTEAEVDFAIKKCVDSTLKLREMRYVVHSYCSDLSIRFMFAIRGVTSTYFWG